MSPIIGNVIVVHNKCGWCSKSFLWGIQYSSYYSRKWHDRKLTEMIVFPQLLSDYKIAGTLQKGIHFCSYLKVTAEIESFLWGFCRSIFYRNLAEMVLILQLLYSDYRNAETLQKWIHFCSFPIVSAEIESFLWGFCKWNLFNYGTKWYYRNLTEMHVFLLLSYRDYRIAETLQKWIHFCSYPIVSAEIESFLWGFCKWNLFNYGTKWYYRNACISAAIL